MPGDLRTRAYKINKREIMDHIDTYVYYFDYQRDMPDDRLAKDSERNPKRLANAAGIRRIEPDDLWHGAQGV